MSVSVTRRVPNVSRVLQTDLLRRRVPRPPDYRAEAGALTAIVNGLAYAPDAILERLVAVALEFCTAHSAGLSVLRHEISGDSVFYWPAIAGRWAAYVGGTTPRHFSPCGIVLDRNAPQLVCHPERWYDYFRRADPPIVEGLLAPFHVDGIAVGTIWIVSHDTARQFDAEDTRRLQSLATCAAGAYQVATALDRVAAIAEASARVTDEVIRLNRLLQRPPPVTRRLPLSAREFEVVRLVAQGHTNQAIAHRLGVNVKTVETYRGRATDKLGLRSRADVVSYALAQGWLQST